VLILLEGPDGAGKSSLAAKLATELKKIGTVEQWHKGPPTKHPLDEYEMPLLKYRPGRNHHIIADRWHLGELVYPHVFGRESKYSSAVHHHLEAFLRSRGALLVYTCPPIGVLKSRLARRGDSMVEADQLLAIVKWYMGALTFTQLPVYRGHGTSDLNTVSSILRAGRLHEQKAYKLNSYITYTGSDRPKFLLVGDIRKNQERVLGPAFMPYPATSGVFLHDALPFFDVVRHCGVMNVNDVDDFATAHKILGEPLICALGKNAHERLESMGIEHGAVPHPQYVRRFMHHAIEPYGDLIKEVLSSQENQLSWRL